MPIPWYKRWYRNSKELTAKQRERLINTRTTGRRKRTYLEKLKKAAAERLRKAARARRKG